MTKKHDTLRAGLDEYQKIHGVEQRRIVALESQLKEVTAERNKFQRSAQNFCSAHIGHRFISCPTCLSDSLYKSLNIAKKSADRLQRLCEQLQDVVRLAMNIKDPSGMQVCCFCCALEGEHEEDCKGKLAL